jgi:hypothetical protein
MFSEQIRASRARMYRARRATQADTVLIGGLIGVMAGSLDCPYALTECNTSARNHSLRFEDMSSGNRVWVVIRHLVDSEITAKVLGHPAEVSVTYGEWTSDVDSMRLARWQEAKGGYITNPEPGIITVDADPIEHFIHAKIDLLWDLSDYMDPQTFKINPEPLARDMSGILHGLRKYLRGRFRVGSAL